MPVAGRRAIYSSKLVLKDVVAGPPVGGSSPSRGTRIMQVVFVTGNQNKLQEAQAILPGQLTSEKLDLTEIQSLDIEEIVRHKLKEAYAILKKPVIVEDVSAELASLNGLPGPFVKFFEERLGKGALHKLSKVEHDRVTITCCAGYFDGEREEIVKGVIEGTIVPPRGEDGFGFDFVVVPDGHTKTMAEMGRAEKNTLSHRYVAFKMLAKKLKMNQA